MGLGVIGIGWPRLTLVSPYGLDFGALFSDQELSGPSITGSRVPLSLVSSG